MPFIACSANLSIYRMAHKFFNCKREKYNLVRIHACKLTKNIKSFKNHNRISNLSIQSTSSGTTSASSSIISLLKVDQVLLALIREAVVRSGPLPPFSLLVSMVHLFIRSYGRSIYVKIRLVKNRFMYVNDIVLFLYKLLLGQYRSTQRVIDYNALDRIVPAISRIPTDLRNPEIILSKSSIYSSIHDSLKHTLL